MKKIGIMTYFWSYNPGTFLQAYATLAAFKNRLHDDRVEIIDVRQGRLYFRPYLSSLPLQSIVKDYIRYLKYKKARREHFIFSNDGIITKNENKAIEFLNKLKYDLIVIGSDTILEIPSKYLGANQIPIYWLPTDVTALKVMCASSARSTSFWDLKRNQRDILGRRVKGFSLLGVRDQSTYDLIKELGGTEIIDRLERVPDPSFTYEIDRSHADRYVHQTKIDLSKPTIGMHFPRSFKLAEEVAPIFRELGYQIVSFRPARFADFCFNDVSPFEWAGIFANFKLMMTSRFHDTLFSLKNLVPVISIVPNSSYISYNGDSKFLSLLNAFGMGESNLVSDYSTMDANSLVSKAERAMTSFDRDKVATTLNKLREQYYTFVDRVIGLVRLYST